MRSAETGIIGISLPSFTMTKRVLSESISVYFKPFTVTGASIATISSVSLERSFNVIGVSKAVTPSAKAYTPFHCVSDTVMVNTDALIRDKLFTSGLIPGANCEMSKSKTASEPIWTFAPLSTVIFPVSLPRSRDKLPLELILIVDTMPEETHMLPLFSIKVLFAEPQPDMVNLPPETTVVLSAIPPLKTSKMPPLLIVVLFTEPSEETCIPPELIVVLFADPPPETKTLPELRSVPSRKPPDRIMTSPPFTMVRLATPPAETRRLPSSHTMV